MELELIITGLAFLALACVSAAIATFAGEGKESLNKLSSFTGICGSLLTASGSLLAFAGDREIILGTYPLAPGIDLYFGIDRLSGIFLLLLAIVSCAVSLYILGDLKEGENKNLQKRISTRNALMYGFIISMALVLISRDIVGFIISWELMAISSFLLVMFEYEDKKTQRAGMYYFAMTQLSTVFIISGFLALVSESGSYTFSGIAPVLGEPASLIFCLLLVGFSIKAGVIPLHKWLPYAHPAAPSAISALMSGVMLNIAVYGLLRVLLDITEIEIWWGGAIIVLGLLSAVLGVMYAMKESDIKALLVYSSIENIGIIFLGIGLFVLFTASSYEFLGMLALAGSLIHAFSHGIVKSLLFMTAGSVVHSVHTRDIDERGGLIKRMPNTGFIFFVGAIAISVIPPLCCFAGELMIFESLIYSFQEVGAYMRLLILVILSLFALTSAMSAACFVKAFGISFLGLPRSKCAEEAEEVHSGAVIGPAILAGVCILTGVFSGMIMDFAGYPGFLPDMLSVSLLLLLVVLLVYASLKTIRHPSDRISVTWDCGIRRPASRIEYTSEGFSQPLVTIFSSMFRTKQCLEKEYYDSEGCIFKSGTGGIRLIRFFEEYIYIPAGHAVERFAELVSRHQNGSLDTYLLYLFITVVSVIIYLGLMQ
ncbi:proton-conducting transporter membrane subunit [Methanolacinia petrolearia]|uniref:proton-conducting transporter transmembrane domain-containing protein n=1 Tax=Methanolacinia petrolearia TaxID=54120 RepID=UPI003BAA258A